MGEIKDERKAGRFADWKLASALSVSNIKRVSERPQ